MPVSQWLRWTAESRVARRVTPSSGKKYHPKEYWVDYMKSAGKLLLERPDSSVLSLPSLLGPTLSTAVRCRICAPIVWRDMMNFINRFGKVTKAISTVPFNIEYLSA
ncbi:hypothetical protein A0H81_04912 [Grifola frondosa]|uniref:Uncharacterized protein n=1 Tax=Grifola frondosa TaxID=5627 RepID=A0A1C7MFG6_GRIFR|nr:hypothetical protein A0H81_04912 [Grifola frondosa]